MSNDEPGPDEPAIPRKPPIEKPIEKVKRDNEKLPFNEKLPIEKQKLEKPELKEVKNELKEVKEHKNELKEQKHEKEKREKEKSEKEAKLEKFEKVEKLEKNEKFENEKLKDGAKNELEKRPFEKTQKENIEKHVGEGGQPFDPDILRRQAEALEESARQLRHFIDEGERPDLGGGALRDEPDQPGDG